MRVAEVMNIKMEMLLGLVIGPCTQSQARDFARVQIIIVIFETWLRGSRPHASWKSQGVNVSPHRWTWTQLLQLATVIFPPPLGCSYKTQLWMAEFAICQKYNGIRRRWACAQVPRAQHAPLLSEQH